MSGGEEGGGGSGRSGKSGSGGSAGGNDGGVGGGDGQPALTLTPPVTHCAPDHHTHVATSLGHTADVDTEATDDHIVPADGPISQRCPAVGMKYRYDSAACMKRERPLELSNGSSEYVPACARPCTRCAVPVISTIMLAHAHDISGGGGAAGGWGGGSYPHRGPQSVQSVPYSQFVPSAPGPPSSHNPSECRNCVCGTCVPGLRQLSVHVQCCPGGKGGGDGDGGHSDVTFASSHTQARADDE